MESQQLAQRTRATKTDFAPLYKNHRATLEAMGLNHEDMVKTRRHLHTIPEHGFQEFKTQKVLREKLLGYGVKPEEIKDCAITGLVVDLKGIGEEDTTGPCTVLALRADMDGLPIPEGN